MISIMKLSDLNYIKDALQWIDENTTLNDINKNIEIYSNLFCNSMNVIEDEINNKISVNKLIESEIISKFGYDFKELQVKSRKRKYVLPRQITMYLINEFSEKKNHDISFVRIAKIFDINRGTVRHSIKTINNFIETDSVIRDMIKEIKNNIDEQL